MTETNDATQFRDDESFRAPLVSTNDPLRPRTEAQRVLEVEELRTAFRPAEVPTVNDGLMRHLESGHLVGIEAAPLPGPLALSPTVDAEVARRHITAEEAARRIATKFDPVVIATDNVRHEGFLKSVAIALRADPNPANLEQIAKLLTEAKVYLPDHEYPKMLFSRSHPENGHPGTYDPRHDHVSAIVANEDEASALGSGWVDSIHDLPPRGDIPVHLPNAKARATPPAHAPEIPPHTELGGSI
jgi:hypothetical protein